MPLNLSNNISQAIPGFGGNTASASNLIKELLSGKLTSGERREIFRSGAERGTMSGMPGSTGVGGSLFANADLRNIGLASGQRQQQGFDDLLSMLGVYSGTVFPTAGQELQDTQFNKSLEQDESQFSRNLNFDRERFGEDRRRFNFSNFINRPYSSTRSGDLFDATGRRIRNDPAFKY
jgi:hypothetical protein